MEDIGSLLFWGRAINNNLLTALSKIAASQEKSTKTNLEEANHLLNHYATHLNPTIIFQGIQMVLHSDALYLSA